MVARMQDGSAAGLRSACAACKHQRKKCNDTCILSVYFPANKDHAFKSVHKVFGVSNITKIIKNVKEDDRRRVVDSLVWEACCRQKDPVQGPYGEYRKLFDEYIRVFNELKIHRNHPNMHKNPTPFSQQTDQDFVAWESNGNGMMCKEDGISFGQDTKNGLLESTMYAYNNCIQRQQEAFIPIPMQQQQQQTPTQFYFSGDLSTLNGFKHGQ